MRLLAFRSRRVEVNRSGDPNAGDGTSGLARDAERIAANRNEHPDSRVDVAKDQKSSELAAVTNAD